MAGRNSGASRRWVRGDPWEQSATVFKGKDGQCYYPQPKTGPLPGQSPRDLSSGKLSPADKPVAHAHSHIKGDDFSAQDKKLADGPPPLPEYILGPGGDMRVYDPRQDPPINKPIGKL